MSFRYAGHQLLLKSILRPAIIHQARKPLGTTVRTRFVTRTMASGGPSSPPSSLHQNRLAQEKSPYLLQHASNPVDWYPWGQDAFDKAKKENKPIFLSVGYSTCHWCHVMERESFENADIGKIMNDNFVCIKVDREERPDVDRVYMTFVQATSGGGGWPMSVWLTPDLKPIVGGTYFPPHDRFGRPGFGTVLRSLAKQWRDQKSNMEERSTSILDALMQATTAAVGGESLPGIESLEKCYKQLTDSYDKRLGGFGDAPKFPQPVNFNFMFRLNASRPEDHIQGKNGLDMTLHTLRMMAKGGIHDHISQGFHRYSTDQYWHVPHFEKMLYDQGQLAVSYMDAYQITKEEVFAEVGRDIFLYVSRDLSNKHGGFYSAEDADSLATADAKQKTEGAFCVWNNEEVKTLLSNKVEGSDTVTLSDVFCKHYCVTKGGNVDFEQDPHGELKNNNVLIVRGSLEDTANQLKLDQAVTKRALAKSRQILYDERLKRPKPHLDDKMLTAWNGLMISGLARGGQVLGDQQYTDRAIQAAEFIKNHLYNPDTKCLLRSAYCDHTGAITQISEPIHGFVDDYAFLIRGLLDLYEACYDQSWLKWACQLQEKQDELFWDAAGNSGYFSGSGNDPSILLRLKEDQDGAEPSGNSVSALNLLRLAQFTDNSAWREKAEQIFTAFENRLKKIPMALPEMVSALLLYQSTAKQIIIHGDKDAADTKELLSCVHSHFLPNKIIILSDGDPSSFLSTKLSLLSTLQKKDDKATAYVCENYTCELPVNTTAELETLLKK